MFPRYCILHYQYPTHSRHSPWMAFRFVAYTATTVDDYVHWMRETLGVPFYLEWGDDYTGTYQSQMLNPCGFQSFCT